MARLYEYQSKQLLAKGGIVIPHGKTADTPKEAGRIAAELGKPVVIKAQAWVTGRAGAGGVKFAKNHLEAEEAAAEILGMDLKGFKVREVLVEEQLEVDQELYLGLIIDDARECPVMLFSSMGGSGIEEISAQHPENLDKQWVEISSGLKEYEARDLLRRLEIRGALQKTLAPLLVKFYKVCRNSEARSCEINPLIITRSGEVVAADCHMAVDDYAVFRHPEMGIEIAREFDRPATPLEKSAYQVEAKDHRGTFYFLQMSEGFEPRSGYVGFHGAGGGGSMMSMDALQRQGFKIANFCDTSGNPSAAKVYRAAKIILSQPNVDAYFASGSGVASQEQYHSARGLVKAFREAKLAIPAVIRIGGNSEEMAMDILHTYTKDLPGKVEAYGRETSAAWCAQRLREIVDEWDYQGADTPSFPELEPPQDAYSFETMTGAIYIDHPKCIDCQEKPCVMACSAGVLKLEDGKPVLALDEQLAKKGKCTECLACDIACEFNGNKALMIHLPIPGFAEAVKGEE